MYYFVPLTILMFFLLLFSTFYLMKYRNMYTHLSKQQHKLDEKLKTITDEYTALKNEYCLDRSFTDHLLNVDKETTQLQITQSTYLADVQNSTIPERYQYINSASGHGANAVEIARLFSISNHEAEQLSNLSQLNVKKSILDVPTRPELSTDSLRIDDDEPIQLM